MINLYLYLVDILVPFFFGTINFLLNIGEEHNEQYLILSIVFSLSILILSFIKNYYKDYYVINFSEKIKIAIITWLFAIFIQLFLFNYLLIKISFSIIIIWLFIPLTILLVKYYIKIKSKHVIKSPIHIIGNLYTFNDYEIQTLKDKGYKFFFHVTSDEFLNKSISNTDSVVVLNLSPADILLIESHKYNTKSSKILKLEEFFEEYLRKIYIHPDNNLFNIHQYNRYNYSLKIIIDFVSVIILAPILSIILIFVYFIKKTKKIKGSLFYKQKRYGLNNKTFDIYKLRTMTIDSDHEGNTTQNDPRIYPFAKIIRKLRLDEIPQIINILFGHMHLVGPRAEWVDLSNEYNKKIINYGSRHIVKPGITGWAQISYPYGTNDYDAEQKFMYDIYYIKNWTIWLEIEICIKTVLVILDKKGF